MEIEIVKFFQGLASEFLNVFFWLITKLGEETVFLIVVMGIYLCYDKFFAVKYSLYYLLSVGINNLVKLLFLRPRPYVVSNEIINRLPALGKSFPSGHSQGYFVQATIGMVEINKKNKNKPFKLTLLIAFSFIGLLVMISRMFWGQHYPSDVIIGMMFGLALPFVFDWLIGLIPQEFKNKFTKARIYFGMILLAIFLFGLFFAIELSINFASRKVYKFLGVYLAMGLGYVVDEKFIKYKSKQGWLYGLLKFVIATLIISLIYWVITLIVPLKTYVYFIVYLFLGLVATIIMPLCFKFIFRERNGYGEGNIK